MTPATFGTMYAPGRQSPAKPGGASSSLIEVAWRKRTKLTPPAHFVGVVTKAMVLDWGPICSSLLMLLLVIRVECIP